MRYFFIIMLLFSTAAIAQKNGSPSVIPEPEHMELKPGHFLLTAKTLLVCDRKDAASAALFNEFLYASYGYRLKTVPVADAPLHAAVQVLRDESLAPESYKLTVSSNSVQIRGGAAGIFYGLQTFQQLFHLEKTSEIPVPCLEIDDRPRFGYRGLMLDVSRHFFSVGYIKKFLDVMAHYKLNNFHWHLTDDQGWRVEIRKYPLLQQVAAWRKLIPADSLSGHIKNGQYGGFYTREEIRDVVAYAATRHINVIPEIEMPGHSGAALAAYPSLGCTGGPYQVLTSGGINKEVYCAGNEAVFSFLKDVIDEVSLLFPSEYIHVGGDETPKDRWKACARCQARMKHEGLKDGHELQSYFIQRVEKYVKSKGKKIIGWDEILEGGLAPNATVMSWRGEAGGTAAARLKHDVIMSPYTYVYLDYYQGKPAGEPPAIGGYLPLSAVYGYEPLSSAFSEPEFRYVKGVQANIWAEYIASDSHMDYMAFPRALAVAETGWSAAGKKNYTHFLKKLPFQLAALSRKKVSFRIPEPFGLKDSVTTAAKLLVNLQPAVQGARVYYSLKGSAATLRDAEAVKPVKLELRDNLPVRLNTLTVLADGRSKAHSATYVKRTYEKPVIAGDFVHIFNPNDSRSKEDTTWYTNDHSFIKGNDGNWHAYGIIGHHPVRPWGGETKFFHITTNSLKQKNWEDHGYAMTAQEGKERVLWAPHVVKEKGSFYMFYNTGNLQKNAPDYASWGQLCLAKSEDLKNWERHPLNPLFSDAGHARDSYLMKYKGKNYYYYTRTYNEVDHRSVVALRTGPDLFHWSGPRVVHTQPYVVNWGGDAESPFVIERNGIFYLFICRAMTKYNQTDVYWSKNPENFPVENLVCSLPVHAAEIIYDKKEGWFISNSGWDKKGLYLAPLKWVAATSH